MTNPWNLYDSLIDEIPGHITVAAAYTGTKWCRVTSSERGAGMAFAMPVRTRPASYGEDDLAFRCARSQPWPKAGIWPRPA